MATKRETIFIFSIILIIIGSTLVNLQASYRKSRDNERKNAMGDIVRRLGDFEKSISTIPLSSKDNKIVGCDGFRDKLNRWFFKDCAWGENKVNTSYFDPLPQDPYVDKGRKFVYASDGKTFRLYVALEGKYEDEFDPKIAALGISCGDTVCNAGRTNGPKETLYTPL